MRNTYPGTCLVCAAAVPAGDGWFQSNWRTDSLTGRKYKLDPKADKWVLRCLKCKGAGNRPTTR